MTRPAACVVCLALATACTARTAPGARKVGQVLAIAGVVGLVGTVALQGVVDEDPLLVGFSVMSGGGILTFAAGDLSQLDDGPPPETEQQKLRRWARILTGRAAGAAREGRCPRVRKYERRVHLYDPEVHDFVFMRDPEILRCLDTSLGEAPPPASEPSDALPVVPRTLVNDPPSVPPAPVPTPPPVPAPPPPVLAPPPPA